MYTDLLKQAQSYIYTSPNKDEELFNGARNYFYLDDPVREEVWHAWSIRARAKKSDFASASGVGT